MTQSTPTTTPEEIFPVVIGTSGHVDHGKSTLVRALTGIEPDRLKEEKARGLTIDIGFANFLDGKGRRVGIVDVPGHERFIKNMVTGATGVDLVMLVIAADDGVMPQTREHLEILQLLGVTRGIVVVTKVDLVDQELLELAVEDIKDALAGSAFAKLPMLMISSHTGAGLDELRAEIDRQLAAIGPHSAAGAFRMPVQRVFSVKGHGAVLTGIPLSGAINVGDEIETLPSKQRGKLRSIQAYHGPRERAQAGHSSALNVGGIEHAEVHRGHVVATPGYARPTSCLIARVDVLEHASQPLAHRDEMKLYLDNSEVLVRAHVLEKATHKLQAGQGGIVRFDLEEPIVPAIGDRFILRVPSPTETLGGGRVLSLDGANITRKDQAAVALFHRKFVALDDKPKLLASCALEAGINGASRADLAKALWLLPAEIESMIEALLASGEVRKGIGERVVHRDAWAAMGAKLVASLHAYHEEHANVGGIREAELAQRLGLELRVFNAVLESQLESRAVVRAGELIAHPDFVISLSAAQEGALGVMRKMLREGGFTPPSLDELKAASGLNAKDFRAVTDYLTAGGEAVLIAATFLLHRDCLDEAIKRARALIAEAGEMRAADFKNALETSRKYAIPILEHLDGKGVFINSGGVRTMRK